MAAITLIAIGVAGVFLLGFLALFVVGGITSNTNGVRSQIGAVPMTSAPILCAAAEKRGAKSLKVIAVTPRTALPVAQKPFLVGVASLLLAARGRKPLLLVMP